MARTVNEQEYALKRSEILAATRKLLYRKGYDQITIKDVIDEVQISKGAFYHYFESKQALLEALLDQTRAESEVMLRDIISDTSLPPVARLQHFFDTVGRWKVAQKEYVLSLLRSWYADENVLVRLRVQEGMVVHIAPLLNHLIAEGVAEGTFHTAFPDVAGQMILTLLVGMGDTFAKALFVADRSAATIAQIERMIAAYNDAIDRVLGVPAGTLHLIDEATTREWFVLGGAA
ncbi:TetR/AcrR family transcriptional regulator [Candidatus Oscillochloris fontis]|uniref:TetR/AcrR family transcriptional regulator n=1 Tax=Candidatus Oscillochloris fontis TaxID=2496868 RepID=UPI00101E1DF0|nr:TetR/AcrR family transcriptional regulator [Candidatus Oscillochloris fontis]